MSENAFSTLFIYGKIYQTLIFIIYPADTNIIFNCSVEEDGAVAIAGISGQDEKFLDESTTVDSPELLEVLNQAKPSQAKPKF